MSHKYASLPELLSWPHLFTQEAIVDGLRAGFNDGDAFMNRPEHPHVTAFRTDKKVGPVVKSMINRTLDAKSPFEAGLIFDTKVGLEHVMGLVVVNRNVKVVKHETRNPDHTPIGPQVDTINVALFENNPAEIEVANRFILEQLGLRKPVAIEPESSDGEIKKALFEVYGSGIVGNFMAGINGRPISSTAYGLNL
jgi:hypothetical protein